MQLQNKAAMPDEQNLHQEQTNNEEEKIPAENEFINMNEIFRKKPFHKSIQLQNLKLRMKWKYIIIHMYGQNNGTIKATKRRIQATCHIARL